MNRQDAVMFIAAFQGRSKMDYELYRLSIFPGNRQLSPPQVAGCSEFYGKPANQVKTNVVQQNLP